MLSSSGRTRVLLSLITSQNDYQNTLAAEAEKTAQRLDVELQIVFADNDAVNQSQQVLKVLQSKDSRPDGLVVCPMSDTGLVQAAKLAASSGVGWVVINRKVDYISSIQGQSSAPICQVVIDHVEIGRIQGQQIGALMPEGGLILYIQGPTSSAATNRALGFNETKPANIEFRTIKSSTWTEESAHDAICAWLRLSTSRELPVRAIVAQNDAMAMGARRAFEEQMPDSGRQRWLALPFLGCDGTPQVGQAWVRNNWLRATVVNPVTTGIAIETLVNALRTGKRPQETTVLSPSSYPPIDKLRR